jgi:hypothetical protein
MNCSITRLMKNALIAATVSLLITSTAAASEEIQLAEAIGGASTSTIGSGAAAPTQTLQTASAFQTADTVAIGVIAAAILGIVAGTDSASTH